MELRQLNYFLTVARFLHFRKAAEDLHISEQPLSYQIRKLENELGFKLFERTTRSVKLTPAGIAFRNKVTSALNIIEQGVHEAKAIANGQVGVLRIAYNSMGLHNVMPTIVHSFRSEFSKIKVELIEKDSPSLEKAVINNQVDVGIVAYYDKSFDKLDYRTIYTDSAMIAVAKGSLLPVTGNNDINLVALSNMPFITYSRERRPYSYDQLITVCHNSGFTPNIIQEADTDLALLGLVASGLGIAIVPGSFMDTLSSAINYYPLKKPEVTVKEAVIWKKGNNSHIVSKFLNNLNVND
ncbi:LysR family transcriptional regulator [Leuconostoc inhae]|uniref:LysR family transcriptional regulator n=1 Tax=Leuconostoc inhae TaxID=178001 RepID=UPI001C7DE5FA|nr:LysR family transcriptional regulator [Leuconostoc inhae]